MAPRKHKANVQQTMVASGDGTVRSDNAEPQATSQQRPLLPPEAGECFAVSKRPPSSAERLEYRPALVGAARLHFVDAKHAIDQWQNVSVVSLLDDQSADSPWAQPDDFDESHVKLDKPPDARATFAELPATASRAKSYSAWQKDLASNLYSDRTFDLWQSEALGESSRWGETKDDFLKRLGAKSSAQSDGEKRKLSDSYAKKIATLDGQIQRAGQTVEKQKGQRWQKIISALLSFVTTVLGALGGRKIASQRNITAAATAARRAGSIASEQSDVAHAEESLESLEQRRNTLQAELDTALAAIDEKYKPNPSALTPISIHPRKTDIAVSKVALVWLPYRTGPGGECEPAY
jgi:hypothetical protein